MNPRRPCDALWTSSTPSASRRLLCGWRLLLAFGTCHRSPSGRAMRSCWWIQQNKAELLHVLTCFTFFLGETVRCWLLVSVCFIFGFWMLLMSSSSWSQRSYVSKSLLIFSDPISQKEKEADVFVLFWMVTSYFFLEDRSVATRNLQVDRSKTQQKTQPSKVLSQSSEELDIYKGHVFHFSTDV